MTKLNIKKGDTVVVISGKDKGKSGKVLETVFATNRAVVDGVNIITKHQKAKNAKEKGGIVKKPATVDISNLMVICSSCGKATRISKTEVDGKNVRVCKKCGASLDKAFVKAKKEAKKKEEVKVEKTTEKVETTAKTAVKKPITKKPVSEKVSAKKPTAKTTSQIHKASGRGI